MGKITRLAVQAKNKQRINVYIDDEFALGLAYDVAVFLKIGQDVSPELLEEWQEKDTFIKAKQKGINYVSYRPRSIQEVRNHLEKDFESSVADVAIDHLLAVGLLDDVAFATYWVDQRVTFKPRGCLALQMELRQKGVSRAVIDEVLLAVDETAVCLAAAQQKLNRYKGLPRDQFWRKLGSYLQRRGFHYATFNPVLEQLWQETTTND